MEQLPRQGRISGPALAEHFVCQEAAWGRIPAPTPSPKGVGKPRVTLRTQDRGGGQPLAPGWLRLVCQGGDNSQDRGFSVIVSVHEQTRRTCSKGRKRPT